MYDIMLVTHTGILNGEILFQFPQLPNAGQLCDLAHRCPMGHSCAIWPIDVGSNPGVNSNYRQKYYFLNALFLSA